MNTKKAKDGMWLTQIEPTNESARTFVKEVSSFGSIDNWRDATQEEKSVWDREQEEKQKTEMLENINNE